MTKFEWDISKAKTNLRKHGISFEFATAAFRDPFALEWIDDRDHHDEIRTILLGFAQSTMLVVVYTERNERIRLISARKALKNEKALYYRENED